MTAQSFAEAFTAPPLTDAADALLAAAERIKSLDAWVVALENRIEKALDILRERPDYALAGKLNDALNGGAA